MMSDASPSAGGALDQLRGLAERQTLAGHFGFAPIGGCDASATRPMFDQQPMEDWAMASACARAFTYTPRPSVRGGGATCRDVVPRQQWRRRRGLRPVTCGGFDGLEWSGVNRNEGAKSSMAFVGKLLDLRELAMVLEGTPD
jgi:hypothetical protein